MSSMNFNTSNQTLRQLMGNGIAYKVPPFQRDYSWTADEWDDLWQDIVGLFEDEPEPAHYMGYLVLQSADSKHFDIIDGQQRITTLSVMVLAAISYLGDLTDADDEKNSRRAEQLRNSYIGYLDPVTLVPRSKLQLNRHNDRFYQTYLVPLEKIPQRGLSASEHLLRKGFAWFKDHIKQYVKDSGEQTAKFIETVVDKLFFTVITVTDELNAFKVFETLNARGVRLSSTDLLKNYLFSVVNGDGAHDTELKALEEQWEGIVGLLESENFPEFLRTYWNSRNKLVRKSDLFKTIRREINSKGEAFSLIRNLDANAGVYRALRNPSDDLWATDESQHVKDLLMFNVRQPLSLLLAAFMRFGVDDRPAFHRILRAVSIISFRYNVICNMQTSEQERVYNDVAARVSSGGLETAREVIQALMAIYPEDSRFRSAFKDKDLRTTDSRNKRVVRHILFGLERHLTPCDYDFESATISVEHIMPEQPEDGWEHVSEPDHEKFVYRLGNMTLLHSGQNKDVGNAEFADKHSVYAESDFALTRKVAEHFDEWNPEKIETRQDWMSRQATSIWRLDF